MLGGMLLAMACGDPGMGPDPTDGIMWHIDGEAVTAPAVVDSIVAVGLTDGRLLALHRSTGRSLWERRFDSPFRVAHLTGLGDLLIVPHRLLHGVDVRTGTIRWNYGDDILPGGLTTPPTRAGDTLFIVGLEGGLVASLDARTGTVHWRRPLGTVRPSPTVAGDLVIYQVELGIRSGAIVALDRRSGQERWRYPHEEAATPFAFSATGTTAGDDLVINLSSRLVALRLADGSEHWTSRPTAIGFISFAGAPLVTDGQVLLTTFGGTIERFSLASGSPLGSTPLPGFEALTGTLTSVPCGSSLCLAQRHAWIVHGDGSVRWRWGETSPVFLSRITVDGDGIMFAGTRSTDGQARVIAFQPPVYVGPTP